MAQTRKLATDHRQMSAQILPPAFYITHYHAARRLRLELIQSPPSGDAAVGLGPPRVGFRFQMKRRAIFAKKWGGQRIGPLKHYQQRAAVLRVLLDEWEGWESNPGS